MLPLTKKKKKKNEKKKSKCSPGGAETLQARVINMVCTIKHASGRKITQLAVQQATHFLLLKKRDRAEYCRGRPILWLRRLKERQEGLDRCWPPVTAAQQQTKTRSQAGGTRAETLTV